jgi:hypothetical protein
VPGELDVEADRAVPLDGDGVLDDAHVMPSTLPIVLPRMRRAGAYQTEQGGLILDTSQAPREMAVMANENNRNARDGHPTEMVVWRVGLKLIPDGGKSLV